MTQLHYIKGLYFTYNLQKRYRSGVGSLLYIVKHSLPELYNAVWELSKSMEKSNMRHYKALLHITNYLFDIKDYFYRVKPYGNLNGPLEPRGYSDADCIGSNDNHKPVTGYMVIINGLVISWRSQDHKTVIISVTESEYSAITEVCCKILFSHAILFDQRELLIGSRVTVSLPTYLRFFWGLD